MKRRTLLAGGLGIACSTMARPSLAAAATPLLIEDLNTGITPAELASFKTWMHSLEPNSSPAKNEYLYGDTGFAPLAMNTMFRLTGDIDILNRSLQFCDVITAARNDRQTGVVMWTGRRDPVWPMGTEGREPAGYFGVENGFPAGLLCDAARAIWSVPVLSKAVVPDGDPYGFGRTYGERASHYLAAADEALGAIKASFFTSTTSDRAYFPDNSAWGSMGERFHLMRGKPIPWNIQGSFAKGLVSNAIAHEVNGTSPEIVARNDALVHSYLTWFRGRLVGTKDNGSSALTYLWNYSAAHTRPEDTGHADPDALGVYLGLQRGLGGITSSIASRMANNWVHSIQMDGHLSGTHRFSTLIDGTGGFDRPYLRGYCLRLASSNFHIYKPVAEAFVANGDDLANGVGLPRPRIGHHGSVWATIMWAKQGRFGGTGGYVSLA